MSTIRTNPGTGTDLWNYPADLWPHLLDAERRRENLTRVRRGRAASPPRERWWARLRRPRVVVLPDTAAARGAAALAAPAPLTGGARR